MTYSAAEISAARLRQAAAPKPVLKLSEVEELFAPLPPVSWLVQRLDMCPGAPVLFAGYGFSGKTVAAQSMAVTIAAGGRVWSDFTIGRRGRVVHVDYEQGFRLTAERYQRLARGAEIEPEELRGSLAVAPLPTLYLSSAEACDAYTRACEGAALLIVDSLRACAPDVDENSSEVRRLLDLLTRVSERTGVVPLVIHHARKPREDDGGGAKMAIRGSGAIFDACSSVLVFSAVKGEPTLVAHEKARTSGVTHEDFSLAVEDVPVYGNPRAGLRVRSVGVAPPEVRKAARERERQNEVHERIVAFVAANPGCSGHAVRGAKIDGAKSPNTVTDALHFLETEGRLSRRRGGIRGADGWYVGRLDHRIAPSHVPLDTGEPLEVDHHAAPLGGGDPLEARDRVDQGAVREDQEGDQSGTDARRPNGTRRVEF
ncbi:MAG: AAA family ATPase [Myxococcales bacterium]|nr:AAA family ATPase [Myxococcales bacterium]